MYQKKYIYISNYVLIFLLFFEASEGYKPHTQIFWNSNECWIYLTQNECWFAV